MGGVGAAHAQSSLPDLGIRCTPVVNVAVPGGGQSLNVLGNNPEIPSPSYTSQVARELSARGISTVRSHYSSIPFVGIPYLAAQQQGVDNLNATLSRVARECPASDITLTGYPLGADIAG
ncbi:hypothetical protein C3B44_08370 [Corynebacterium yudongzhengii]|uniref:Cutinase family protein n=1 Tax=Corynebacterium yudongzhengii TaxID=2080740 RepID=A0A2U1T7N6_9CORY|nr:hypothetical protein C3B44_08370 [Corynebacterium yudongzhengii]PWC02014.1 cutinase family protein [Corynebacterium yudongzhengii]